MICALENITDSFEINGIVLRLDYLMRTLVNLVNPQTDEIIRQLGEASNELKTVINEAPNGLTGEVADSNFQVYTQRHGRLSFDIKEEGSCFLSERVLKSPQSHFFSRCQREQNREKSAESGGEEK